MFAKSAKGKAAPFSAQDFLIDAAEGKRDLSAIPVTPTRPPRRVAKPRANGERPR